MSYMGTQIQINGQKTIPTLWRERILKRDYEVVLGKMLQPGQNSEEETEELYLRSANVQWEGVDMSDVKTMWFSLAEKRHLLLGKGDLLVNEGGDVGRCAILCEDIESCYFQNAINRVRARTSASTKFLYYWLYNLKHAGFIDAMVSRITIAHLTAEKLERVPCPDVPAAKQQRIVAYLDASCAAIDAAVAAKRRQIETLDSVRKATIQNVIAKGLKPVAKMKSTGIPLIETIPAHWGADRLRDIAAINSISLVANTDPKYEFDYLEISNVNSHGIVDTCAIERICFENAPSRARRCVTKNSTLISSVRPNLQAILFVSKYRPDFVCSTGFNVVQPNEAKLIPKFIYYALISDSGRQHFEATAKGVGYPAVDDKDFGAFVVPLPPLEEQKAICTYLDTMLGKIKRIVTGIEAQITTLTAYRKSLIHECVTGQRRITEADVAQAYRGREAK